MKDGQRRGVVLFVVTVVIALASLAAYGFLASMQGESKASRVVGDQIQVAHIGASGEEFVAVWLQASRAERSSLAMIYGDTLFSQPIAEPTTSLDATVAGHFHIVVPIEATSHSAIPRPFHETANSNGGSMDATGFGGDAARPFQFGVIDESSKIHLMTLLTWDSIWPGSARNALMQLPGMDATTADSILDWIDRDNEPREFGAETEYYAGRIPPSAPRNGIPGSLDELLQVRGVSRALLLGVNSTSPSLSFESDAAPTSVPIPMSSLDADAPMNRSNSRSRESTLTGTSISSRPWSDFLTVYSAERNLTFHGSPRVNLNNRDLAELHGNLIREFPRDLADFVIFYRQLGPANSVETDNALKDKSTNVLASSTPIDLTLPAKFNFKSVGELIDAVVVLPVEKKKNRSSAQGDDEDSRPRRLASPLSVASGPNPEFSTWLDKLTVHTNKVIPGRINILAADPIVISALPVSDPTIATQIIAARSTLTQDASVVPGTDWLLTQQVLDRESFVQLSQFLTTGGDVARFQIVATHSQCELVNRFEVILDGTVENSQRVYFRDLRGVGHPGVLDMFHLSKTPAETSNTTGFTQVL